MPAESNPLKDAFEKALIPTIEVRQGFIYSVADDPKNPIIKFPEDNLPAAEKGGKKRTFHKQRFVLAVQGKSANENIALPSVLVAPLSHKARETEYSVAIPAEFLALHIPGDSVALINLTQPILKVFLREKVGEVPFESDALKKVRATYLRLPGLI